ncbi:response regulator [Clostridium sp. PL3]|uniref:Response regulator n=1 Tax=Clostridium thailandense TaxID=2794346 RepID=A0A949X2F9_9CLOT|nr:response regulator [Clostridium thailandense]MBV7271338.1 response regulator [Clostridium thailandense]
MKKNKVLFVDDEIQVLNSIKRSTLEEDFETFIAANGEKALELMEQNEFCVVVSDMKMPGMDGLTLLKKIKERHPDVIRMVLSGYNQVSQILSTINQVGVTKFIIKPWSVDEEFLPAIREGIQYYNFKKEGEELKKTLVSRNNAYQNILKVNNDIINNIQKDINNVSVLYDNIQNLNKALLLKSNTGNDITSKVKGFNEIADNIFHGFLNTQPTKIEEFTLTKLIDECSVKLNKRIEFVNIEKDTTFRGNYRLILLIISELSAQIIKDSEDSKLLVDIYKSDIDRLILKIDKSKNSFINQGDSNTRLIVHLLNVINSFFNGNIDLENECISLNFKCV